MLEKLKQLDNKYNEIQQRMESGEIFADPSAYTKCAKELKELEPIVQCYREYCACGKHPLGPLRQAGQADHSKISPKGKKFPVKARILVFTGVFFTFPGQ